MRKIIFFIIINCFVLNTNAQSSSFANYGVFGGNFYDSCNAIVANNSGSFFMAGTFASTVDFNPSIAVANFSASNYSGFISKYSVSTGAFQGIRIFTNANANSSNFIEDMVIDHNGDWLFTGKFKGTVDFDASATANSLTSQGGLGTFAEDGFICKYSATGNFIWVKPISGNSYEYCSRIATDSANNIYSFGGYSDATADFDAGPSVFNLSGDQPKLFVTKLDSNGNFVWAKAFGGSNTVPSDFAIDSNDNLYFTGTYYSQSDFDPGIGVVNLPQAGSEPFQTFRDVFILKLNNNGEYTWAKRFGGTNIEYVNSLAFDSQNNLYCGGEFYNMVDFDPSITELNITSVGRSDGFVSKFDSNGNFINVKTMGGLLEDAVKDVIIDAGQNLIATGSFINSCNFGTTANPYSQTTSLVNDPNMFLIAYDPQNTITNFKKISHNTADFNTYLEGTHLALDSNNNLLTTVRFTGSIVMSLNSGGQTIFLGNQSFDDFLYTKDTFTTLSNSNFNTLQNVQIFPNPTNTILNIALEENANLQIVDMLGKTVYETQLTIGNNNINSSFLNNGIYMAKITNENGAVTQKLIKN
jgi:hypothetical protein